jgi:bifunctional non-homologous end joining protein LigD
MALEEYKRKRDFTKTPEPPAERPASRHGFSYLIQKHDATRLHYDLRLELDGVLLSWAVTKGPSLNPADKRLAVRTEDHPLSYGSFEGTIPEGEYGGGTVMLWDRGTWEPTFDPHAGLKKGHLAFVLHGERLKGAWDLVRMHGREKKENWLLIKKKDKEARSDGAASDFLSRENVSVTTKRSMEEIATDAPAIEARPKADHALRELMKKFPDVQLSTLVDKPPEGERWLHEIKFDGYRLLGFVADGAARLMTRNGNDWTRKFPAIYASIAHLKAKTAVLDMEAVVLDNEGKSSFQAMQQAMGNGGNPGSVQAYVFDLLYVDGKDLAGKPLTARKDALKKLLAKSKDDHYLLYSDHVLGHGSEMFKKSCSMGLEGIVSKLADSPYQMGRQRSWLKCKCTKRQEFVIIGYTAARSGGRAIGALHLGYNHKGQMKYAGKVGTGFSMEYAGNLLERLSKLKVDKPPANDVPRSVARSATWVKPELLCEVAFSEWTEDGHIRQPSFQGLREDKKPQQVSMENPVVLPTANGAKRSAGPLELFGVTISHPDRVIFPDVGVTKGRLAEFYAAAAPWMLKDIARHPVTLLRCPEGMAGECFYQRNPRLGLGHDVKTFRWKHKGKSYEYFYIDDDKGLIELAQMGAIEVHPWGARVDHIDYPDRLIFDLDPDEKVPFEAVKLAAKDLRKRLERRGLESFLKCTGGKGLHVTVPLAEKDTWKDVKEFCAGIANEMVRDVPAAYIATMTKKKRSGKIFVDYFRNDYTATAIADFSVRARPGAPVAAPLEWRELDKLRSANQFTVADALKRLKTRPPSEERYSARQKLPANQRP